MNQNLWGNTEETFEAGLRELNEGDSSRIGFTEDPAARRVDLRESTKEAIRDAAPKTAEGEFIDPNTGTVIPREGTYDFGHKPGYEWWRTQRAARDEGWSRNEVITYENDPSHYQIEDPASNRSHLFELPP